jgi:hypothetical protein
MHEKTRAGRACFREMPINNAFPFDNAHNIYNADPNQPALRVS